MMRITRENVQDLKDALDILADLVDARDDMETWLDNQDEYPKTEDVRDTIRDAREGFESKLEELRDAASSVVDLLDRKVVIRRRRRSA
jgi:hypothetical protein